LAAGSDRLGASLFELPPGCSSFPLHIHHANEELLVVVCGQPTLRTLDGERQLEEGELVAFPSGRTGAHRIDNCGEQPARVLIINTMLAPEINEYPDSGKVWARTFPPGARPVRMKLWTSSCSLTTSAPTTSTTSAEPRPPCGTFAVSYRPVPCWIAHQTRTRRRSATANCAAARKGSCCRQLLHRQRVTEVEEQGAPSVDGRCSVSSAVPRTGATGLEPATSGVTGL